MQLGLVLQYNLSSPQRQIYEYLMQIQLSYSYKVQIF